MSTVDSKERLKKAKDFTTNYQEKLFVICNKRDSNKVLGANSIKEAFD